MDVTMVQFVRQTGHRLTNAQIETISSDATYREVVIGISGTVSGSLDAALGARGRAEWADRQELIATDRHAAIALREPRKSWPAS
ncbi:hypothetical protein ACFJIY_15505 [Pimelobacter simplex]|uniref:hypothetical protein n=1 Tax=Nocardioides simplex TaxID=2045 RepID=UPI00366D7557